MGRESIKENVWKFQEEYNFDFINLLSISASPWIGHIFFAYDLVFNLRPKRIVELGTYTGCSMFSFAQAVKDKNLSSELHAIDTWRGDKHSGYYDKSVFKSYEDIRNHNYKKINIVNHKTTFDKALDSFKDNSIDLLHIDGLHTYEAVKHDFENWLPKVNKQHGIILLHDIAETKADFGVYKIWGEIKKKYQTIEFNHSHGLGVIFLSKSHPFQDSLFTNLCTLYYKAKYNLLCKEDMYDNLQSQNLIKMKDLKNFRDLSKYQEEEIKYLTETNSQLNLIKNEFESFKKGLIWKTLLKYKKIKKKINSIYKL